MRWARSGAWAITIPGGTRRSRTRRPTAPTASARTSRSLSTSSWHRAPLRSACSNCSSARRRSPPGFTRGAARPPPHSTQPTSSASSSHWSDLLSGQREGVDLGTTAGADEQHHHGDGDQQHSGENEGFEIGAKGDPQGAGEIGRCGAADLVDHRDPRDHDPDPLTADDTGQEAHRWRRCGDPVEPVNDAEQGQPIERHVEGKGQIDQGDAAKSIIAAEQNTVVAAVAEPAREGSADQGKDTGGGE